MPLESATSAEFSQCAEFQGERRQVLEIPVPMTIHEPLGSPKGQIVIVPGWSGPRSGPADILVFLASRLAQAGWRVLRLDLPGRGDAGGEFTASGLDEMIHATLLAHGATIRPDEPHYILGMCSGGNVALGTVTQSMEINGGRSTREEWNRVGVIALSTLPFQPSRTKNFDRLRIFKNIKQYVAKAASPGTWARLAKGEINLDRVKKNVTASEKPAIGDRNLKDSTRDIEKELLKWKGRALFVWGGGDEEALPARAHYEKLCAAGMGENGSAIFHTIDGANHNFYGRAWREELIRVVLQFIQKP